jgi:hypothetical protein
MYPCCGSTLLWSIQSLPSLFLNSSPPIPHFLTAVNTHPYILYLHEYYVLQYY